MSLNTQIVKEAETWKGVDYRHRGFTKTGCDCTGLLIGILQSLGYIRDYQTRIYSFDWNLHANADNRIEEELSKVADEIPKGQKQPGDIVLFLFELQRFVAHIGIYIGKNLFIHCWERSKKCQVSPLVNGNIWVRRLVKVYRFNADKLEKEGSRN